jgi:hypothetical protein
MTVEEVEERCALQAIVPVSRFPQMIALEIEVIAPIGPVIPENPASSTPFESLQRQVGYRHCHAVIIPYKFQSSGPGFGARGYFAVARRSGWEGSHPVCRAALLSKIAPTPRFVQPNFAR